MSAEQTPGSQLIEQMIDRDSGLYHSTMERWIGGLRELKHQSRSASPKHKLDLAIYGFCSGIFEQSKYLLTLGAFNVVDVGNAIIHEIEAALPFVLEGSAVYQSIEQLIKNVREGMEQL